MENQIDQGLKAKAEEAEQETERNEADQKMPDEELDKVSGGGVGVGGEVNWDMVNPKYRPR